MTKIVYVVESLVGTGGVERIVTEKTNFLSERSRYNVTIIVCTQHDYQPNAFPLSSSVKQINLGLKLYSQYQCKYPKRLWIKHITNNHFKSTISKIVQQLDPDILIGMGHFKANFICNLNCKAKKIIECHEARFFTQSGMANHQNVLSKLFTKFYRTLYFRTIEKKADAIVTLTEGDKLLWNKAKRIEVIPNFSNMQVSQISSCHSKRIIAVGRLSWEKGYDRLIDIWELVSRKHPEWQLDIFGEGELEKNLNYKIAKKHINNITIHQTTNNISYEFSISSICVMTSYYEGFALVLLEALKHGVPCIAYDCPFGPANIIQDNQCGYLIENGNINLFVKKLCTLMDEDNTRKEFSKESIKRAKAFAIDIIMGKWINLFESL